MATLVKKTLNVLNSPLVAVIMLVWLVYFSTESETAARLHGYLNPVVTPLSVTKIRPTTIYTSDDTDPVPGSIISGSATIRRGECNYEGVAWHLKGANKDTVIDARFADPPEERNEGVHTWDALIVGVTPSMLADTYGEAIHDCGWFPVISPFYTAQSSSFVEAMAGEPVVSDDKQTEVAPEPPDEVTE